MSERAKYQRYVKVLEAWENNSDVQKTLKEYEENVQGLWTAICSMDAVKPKDFFQNPIAEAQRLQRLGADLKSESIDGFIAQLHAGNNKIHAAVQQALSPQDGSTQYFDINTQTVPIAFLVTRNITKGVGENFFISPSAEALGDLRPSDVPNSRAEPSYSCPTK